MATILIIFSDHHGERRDSNCRLILHFPGGANNMDAPRGIGGGKASPAPLPRPMLTTDDDGDSADSQPFAVLDRQRSVK